MDSSSTKIVPVSSSFPGWSVVYVAQDRRKGGRGKKETEKENKGRVIWKGAHDRKGKKKDNKSMIERVDELRKTGKQIQKEFI